MFCLPGNNDHQPVVYAHAAKAGYRANLTIYDGVNTPGTDLFRLCRCPLHVEYPPPFYSAYDPYKRLHQAMDVGGWDWDEGKFTWWHRRPRASPAPLVPRSAPRHPATPTQH